MVCFGYAQDSIPKYTERYSIRFGIDMSKPIRSMIENDYKGLELTADYRITKKLYLAAEVGTEDKRVVSETLDFQTSGKYIKLGVDFNLFSNWEGMENMLLTGFRFGTSTQIQKLYGCTIRQLDLHCVENRNKSKEVPLFFDDLNASWNKII